MDNPTTTSANGALLKLGAASQSDVSLDHCGRCEYDYSLTILVMNNNKYKIFYYVSRFPNSTIVLDPRKAFFFN